MIYTPLTNKAMRFAYQAHHGQLDDNGVPYIFHPIHVAEQMEEEVSCCVSLLHDVLEDAPVTPEELAREFPHPVAVRVKLADLAHNLDQTRCLGTDLPPARLKAWKEKYTTAMAILTE